MRPFAAALSGALLPAAPGLPGPWLPTLSWLVYGVLLALWLVPRPRVPALRGLGDALLHALAAVASGAFLFLTSWPGVPDDSLPPPALLVAWSMLPCLVLFVLAVLARSLPRAVPRPLVVFAFVALFLLGWRALAAHSLAWWWTPPDSALASGPLRLLLPLLGPIVSPAAAAALASVVLALGPVRRAGAVLAVALALPALAFRPLSAVPPSLEGPLLVLEAPGPSDPFAAPPASAFLWLLSENAALAHGVPRYGVPRALAHVVAVTADGAAVQFVAGRRHGPFAKRHALPFIESPSPAPPFEAGLLPVYLCSDASFSFAHGAALAAHTGSLGAARPGWRRRWMARSDLRHSQARALESGAYVVRAVEHAPSGVVFPDGSFHSVAFSGRVQVRLPSSFDASRPVLTFYERWSQRLALPSLRL